MQSRLLYVFYKDFKCKRNDYSIESLFEAQDCIVFVIVECIIEMTSCKTANTTVIMVFVKSNEVVKLFALLPSNFMYRSCIIE